MTYFDLKSQLMQGLPVLSAHAVQLWQVSAELLCPRLAVQQSTFLHVQQHCPHSARKTGLSKWCSRPAVEEMQRERHMAPDLQPLRLS